MPPGGDGVTVSSGVPVYINSNGQLGTVNSSIRFKENVHDNGGRERRDPPAAPGHLTL
jgi:hypothetical protein